MKLRLFSSSLVLGLVSVFISCGSLGATSLYNPPWKQQPGVLDGWTLIDKKEASLSGKKTKDVFILATDGENDTLFWFKRKPKSWEPVVLINVPVKQHQEFGVKSKDLRLFINGATLSYGIEGSEAVFLFRWNKANDSFDIYYPN
jgi:hypothetical protein